MYVARYDAMRCDTVLRGVLMDGMVLWAVLLNGTLQTARAILAEGL